MPKCKLEKPPRLKPVSLWPLKPEEALKAFMAVDRRKVLNRAKTEAFECAEVRSCALAKG